MRVCRKHGPFRAKVRFLIVRRVVLAVALLLTLSACREGFFDPTPSGSGEQSAGVTLTGRNMRMIAGGSNAIRLSFRPKDPSVRLRIERSSSAGRIVACALRGIDDPIPPVGVCIPDMPDGVRENLTVPGLGAIVLLREGDPIAIGFRLEYEEGGREFVIRLPSLAAPPGASVCKDNACNPVLELTPVRGGTLTASARWASGTAKLELLEGRVLARAFSSTGIPYRIAATRSGASPLSIEARLNAPSEYALTLSDLGNTALSAIELMTTWP